jgi:formylglycine-generating enzyme required for sulfatase activity
MPDTVFYQICSAALYLTTAATLTYISVGRPSVAKRLMAVVSIATCALAVTLMMLSYVGERAIALERAGPIERRPIMRDRGYFEFVDKPGAESSGGGSSGRSRGAPLAGVRDDGDGANARGQLRGMVTRIASAAGGLFGTDLGHEAQPCPECPEMAMIEPGYFVMGAPRDDREASANEGPTSVKRIGRRFAIARHETTTAQYMMFARATGRGVPRCPGGRDGGDVDPELPVTCVSWSDAVAHAAWLSARTGRTYRLPSEAEWEYAARAGSAPRVELRATERSTPPALEVNTRRPGSPQRVGTLPPNGFGLHDVGGNVAELAADCWRARPSSLPGDGSPAVRRPCDRRALRDVSAHEPGIRSRITVRRPVGIEDRSAGVGYRLALEL